MVLLTGTVAVVLRYPYPRVVVTELTPPDCTATQPATNWNSTHFDAIMRDFMTAVCK